MTHHHFKNFSYSFAGLTLTYVVAVVFYFLVAGVTGGYSGLLRKVDARPSFTLTGVVILAPERVDVDF